MNTQSDSKPASPPWSDPDALRNRQAAARALRIPVVTGMHPTYTVHVGDDAYTVVIDGNCGMHCSCSPGRAGHWPDSCLHAAAAHAYDMATRLVAQGIATTRLRDCARTGIVSHDQLIPYHQARHRNQG